MAGMQVCMWPMIAVAAPLAAAWCEVAVTSRFMALRVSQVAPHAPFYTLAAEVLRLFRDAIPLFTRLTTHDP